MTYSKTTDEIIRGLNDFVVRAKELALAARKVDSKWFSLFWAVVADDTDQFADRTKEVIRRVSTIAEHPDEITNRFAILKAMENIAFEMNVMAMHVGLSAVARAGEHAEENRPLCEKYKELAYASSMKAEDAARFLNELSSLIFEDMRKTAAQKIADAVQSGKAAVEAIDGYGYIAGELKYMLNELSAKPVEEITVSMLEDMHFKLRIIMFDIKVEVLRSGGKLETMFAGVGMFMDKLKEAAEFFDMLVLPEPAPVIERSHGKHFEDVAFQNNVLLFYSRAEVYKMGSHIDEQQRNAFSAICDNVNELILFAHAASDESAYKEIADRLYRIEADMNAWADQAEEKRPGHGGAIQYLAGQYKVMADIVMNLVK